MSFLFRLLPPILVAFSIFSLDFFHFRIDKSLPSGQMLERAAVSPQDGVLNRVADISLDVSLGIPAHDRSEAAHEVYQGRLPAPNFSSQKLALRGWPADLFVGGPTFQLVMASLSVEDLLLREYESGGRREYYELAKARILEFADWEARQHEPAAFLWNDHAVAARISVLARLWRHLRADPGAGAGQRAALLGLVSRSGGLLAKKSQFTVRTNHGVMQNVALLQISAAFPDLPQADAWKKLAVERLELQLGFYVSSEGVVLEHSSEYHLFGVQLLEYAVQLARLNGMEPSEQLVSAYQRAQEFSKVLARPDGSAPLIGNTAGKAFSQEGYDRFLKEQAAPAPAGEPPVDARLYPVSGYAVWNDRGAVPSQVAVAWAKHDRHGHKHADETSVHFWSRGLDWVTATGYWPYGDTGYDDANGWRGANAPHLRGEAARSARRVELKSHGGGGQVQAVDVENTRESGTVFRRQVVRLGAERLLVVDSVDRAGQPVDTLWTLRPESKLLSDGPAHFIAQPPVGDHVLHLNFAFAGEGQGAAKASAGGSFSPFTGWVVLGRRPTAAPSVEVERVGGSHMTATLFSVASRGAPAPGLSLEPSGTPDEWRATVRTAQGPLQVSRRGAALEVSGPSGGGDLAPQSVTLRVPASAGEPRQALKAAMTEALKRYPIWRELKYFHNRLYLLIAALWLALEVALWLPPVRRRLQPHTGRALALNLSCALAWLLLAWWIHARYLETSAHLLGYLSGH